MELITISNGLPVLRPDIASQIAVFEMQAKCIKEQEETLKKAILEEMEAKGIIGIDTPDLKITYISPTEREKFDSKGFRRDYPDIYDEYITFQPVKSAIRLTVRDKK